MRHSKRSISIGLATSSTWPGGWIGAPWIRQGWFQAHRLYAEHSVGGTAGLWAEAAYRRLVAGEYRNWTERINLERALVAMLAADCERVVVGYTLKREYFNTEYSNGVENVAFDSQAGLLSEIFPRTVKLKDFPWNGWLRLGIATRPIAAWNPVGGFDDAFGRLLWMTMADPALLPDPYGGSWIANRGSSCRRRDVRRRGDPRGRAPTRGGNRIAAALSAPARPHSNDFATR